MGYPHHPHELLAFWCSWAPDRPGRWRWRTWGEYLSDWRRYKAAIAARHPRDGRPAFADLAARYRRRHGLQALDAATHAQIITGEAPS